MVSKAKVAVLISGGGTNLQAIIDRWVEGELPHVDLNLVISDKKDAYGLKRAEKANIECVAITENFEENLLKELEDRSIDIIVLAGFLKILSTKVVNRYNNRIINVHPALIPSFCGKGYYGIKVHKAALEKGVKISGATVHFVNEIPDGGKIIMQKAVEVKKDDTAEELQKRIMEEAEWKILPMALELIAKNLVEE
ncbi:MAG: phosphoribosylglycinamide formyltransferase [Peptostreptococcaceae bacterium]|nr:phosphoribosylglycinamide formyltransferase [Peptostreptococcaceae bacterium]